HEAGCSWGPDPSPAQGLHVRAGDAPEVVLGSVEGLDRRCSRRRTLRDLVALWAGLAVTCRRTEFLWFLLGYLDLPRLTPAARRLARTLLRRVRQSTAETPNETASPALLLPGCQPSPAEGDGAAARRAGG